MGQIEDWMCTHVNKAINNGNVCHHDNHIWGNIVMMSSGSNSGESSI